MIYGTRLRSRQRPCSPRVFARAGDQRSPRASRAPSPRPRKRGRCLRREPARIRVCSRSDWDTSRVLRAVVREEVLPKSD